jgi:hypothetical protein
MRRIFLFLFLALFGFASMTFSNGVKAETMAQNAPQNKNIAVSLGAQNNSNETGAAILMDLGNGKTRVILKMNNASSNAQPAHIHSGSCPNVGAIRYPLNAVVNGVSDSTINASISQLMNQLPLAINVHKSSSEMNISFSCGNIGRQ